MLLWSLAIPLCVAGSQVAHALAYRFVDRDPGARAELLATTGHQYLEYAPLSRRALLVAIGVMEVTGLSTQIVAWLQAHAGSVSLPL